MNPKIIFYIGIMISAIAFMIVFVKHLLAEKEKKNNSDTGIKKRKENALGGNREFNISIEYDDDRSAEFTVNELTDLVIAFDKIKNNEKSQVNIGDQVKAIREEENKNFTIKKNINFDQLMSIKQLNEKL